MNKWMVVTTLYINVFFYCKMSFRNVYGIPKSTCVVVIGRDNEVEGVDAQLVHPLQCQ